MSNDDKVTLVDIKKGEEDILEVLKKNEGVEGLLIYRQYIEMIIYTTTLLLKYPKSERYGLSADVREAIYDGLKDILFAYRFYDKKDKLHYLFELDVQLKFIKALARISYRKKYISNKNYSAWCKKLYNLGNLLGGWIASCQKA